MTTTGTEVLRRFIDDEADSLRSGRQGQFYPRNHHVVMPLVPKAPRLLPAPGDRVGLYFFLLRLGICPKLMDRGEVELVEAAYDRFLPLLVAGYPTCRLGRTQGLFVFGRNDRGQLPEAGITIDTYRQRVETWRYLTSFSNIPGMLRKRDKFVALARDVELLGRVRGVMHRLSLRDDLSGPVCLWFWALVFIALQDDEATADVVAMIGGDSLPDDLASMRATLDRYLDASGRSAPAVPLA